MPRIRNITVAGLFAGATILGGAGLAGATDRDPEPADPGTAQLQADLQEPTAGEADGAATGPEESETDGPTAPTLPDSASDRASAALGAAPAFGDRSAGDPDGDGGSDEVDAAEGDETSEQDNHGQHVSTTAQEADPGPGHGEDVSTVAREHGEAQRGEHQHAEQTDEAQSDATAQQTGRERAEAARAGAGGDAGHDDDDEDDDDLDT